MKWNNCYIPYALGDLGSCCKLGDWAALETTSGLSGGWGTDRDVPADETHWTWSVCPLWTKPQSRDPGCPGTATAGVVHMRRGLPSSWRSLKSNGALQVSRCWGAYFQSPFLESPYLQMTATQARLIWRAAWDLSGVEKWRKIGKKYWDKPTGVLAHSVPIYNPRKGLPLSFLPLKPEWDI